MVGKNFLMTLQTARRGTPRAHSHEIDRHILNLDTIDINQAEQLFEISGNPERRVEQPMLQIHLTTAIKRRMGRHEPELHHKRRELARRIIANALRKVLVIHIMDISIHGIRFADPVRHSTQNHRRRKEIVTVQQPHDIPCSHKDPLVHGIIDTLVRFRDPLQATAVPRFQFTDNIEGIVT